MLYTPPDHSSMLAAIWLAGQVALVPPTPRPMTPTFAAAGEQALPPWLVERAADLGYLSPTPVQAEALDVVLAGRDAIIQAKTGSGKTLAYMLPLIAALKPQSSVQALVLLPTRELASQVALVARRLAAASPERLLVMALLDGSGAKRQRKWLVAQPPQVVVGNVQQVDTVLQARLLRLENLRMLVVDEVDACLGDGETSVLLQRMLGGKLAVPLAAATAAAAAARAANTDKRAARAATFSSLEGRQTLFVSASLPQRQHFRRQCVQQRWCREAPVLVHAEPLEAVPAQLRHGWAPCAPSKRLAALRVLLRRHEPRLDAAIVFAPPSLPLGRLAEALAGVLDDAPPAILAEGQPLNARAAAVRELRERRRRLLISTPLGARGLDVPASAFCREPSSTPDDASTIPDDGSLMTARVNVDSASLAWLRGTATARGGAVVASASCHARMCWRGERCASGRGSGKACRCRGWRRCYRWHEPAP